MTELARVLGDVGGTNARFAWQDGDGAPLRDIATIPTADHPSLAAALAHYLHGLERAAPPWCAIGIANPITGDHVQMTNSHWSFSIEAVRRELGFERLVVINDFTALALAIPDLAPGDLRQLGGAAAVDGGPIALVGPGTGLGVSGLVPGSEAGRWVALQGEGGHVTLAATNDREAAVLGVLRERFGHASAERAVSGQGLEALHAALCTLDGADDAAPPTAAEISRLGLAGSDARCVEVLDLFCAFLGNVAGNLALTLGARGGVYIGGGIVPRLGDAFARSRFRACFEDKGRFRGYLASIPVYVIHAEVSPALLGAARAL
ncbi:glucokinase [Rhizobacter sp. Root404]|jgi:glucokinase|uniref:glucokinase n=1 Tax=Rhizobacter sp. Root404 TaxID=1736528 RepID=UPI0006F6E84E|nr:glucokinase [Rhizobacter sp. Root404]KQW36522.1 glucokinase [Rhizobacter sp. Root404]